MGVVELDDLPLNVSREVLQESSVVRTIKKQIVKRALDTLDELADKHPDDYAAFFKEFGPFQVRRGHGLRESRTPREAASIREHVRARANLTG